MDREVMDTVDRTEEELSSGKVIIERDDVKGAVALSYDGSKEEAAPIVIAKGRGSIAQKIIDSAKEHDISITKDAELVDSLIPLPLGEQIPEELYEAVAQIFAYLSELDEKVGDEIE